MTPDVLVVGAGPVGLAAAIHAAQAGMQVAVIDKRVGPIDKSCGEGLMPEGVRALYDMDVDISPLQRHAFEGIRYIDGDCVAEGVFRDGVGWGVRRTALQAALLARAQRDRRIVVHQGRGLRAFTQTDERVVADTDAGVIEAPYMIAADGLHSRVRTHLGLGSHKGQPARRFGLRRHVRMRPWSPFVEVYWSSQAEAYVTPVGPDEVGIAILSNGAGVSFDKLLGQFPMLRLRIRDAQWCSTVRGAGPLRQDVRRRYRGRVALVGDAAGYVDALTGEGLTLGFRCAQALAGTMAQGLPLRTYERAYRRLSRSYYRDTRMLLQLAAWPRLRHQAIRLLAAWPGLFTWILNHHGIPQLSAPQGPALCGGRQGLAD